MGSARSFDDDAPIGGPAALTVGDGLNVGPTARTLDDGAAEGVGLSGWLDGFDRNCVADGVGVVE